MSWNDSLFTNDVSYPYRSVRTPGDRQPASSRNHMKWLPLCFHELNG
jgi:hypothetical protein